MDKQLILGRDAILGAAAFKLRTIDDPGLGGAIQIRELSGLEAAEFTRRSMELVDTQRSQVKDAPGLARLSAQVWVWGVIDEQGEPLLQKDDISRLVELPARILDKVADEILDLSGLSQRALNRAKKNSTSQSGASGTG